jgi:hypothetical protein
VNCLFCGENMDALRVDFKACCSACGHYLHSCVQCGLFERSSGRCRSLTTDSVRDLEGMNYCEEYQFRKNSREEPPTRESSDAANRFNSLFKDSDQTGK